MYGNSASNLGAHWKARRDMINSTMNRNSSLIRFDNKQREQGFLDLARKTKSNNHIFYTFALRRMRIFSIVNLYNKLHSHFQKIDYIICFRKEEGKEKNPQSPSFRNRRKS